MTAESFFIDAPVALLQLFGSRAVAFGIGYAILAAAGLLAIVTLRGHRRFKRSVAAVIRIMRSADGEPADRPAAIDGQLAGPFAELWRPYRAAIEPGLTDRATLVNLISPYDWFALDRLPGRGYARWVTVWPGVFLTLGLLCTFAGLAAALLQVGDIGSGADMAAATDAVLRISSAKFVTSIAGLIAYIGWTLLARRILTSDAAAAHRLAAAIQALSTPTQPEALLYLAVKRMTQQTAQLQAVPDAIGTAIVRRLDARITLLTEQTVAAAEALAQSSSEAVDRLRGYNEQAIGAMAQRIGEDIRNGAGTEMHAVVAALRDAAGELLAARAGIAAGGGDLHRELAAASERMRTAATAVDLTLTGSARKFGEVFAASIARAAQELALAGQPGVASRGNRRLFDGRELATAPARPAAPPDASALNRELATAGTSLSAFEREVGQAAAALQSNVQPLLAAVDAAGVPPAVAEALLAQAKVAIAALANAATGLHEAECRAEARLDRVSALLTPGTARISSLTNAGDAR